MPRTAVRNAFLFHCLVTPDRRLGVYCKRRRQHFAVLPAAEFLATESRRCAQCERALRERLARAAAA